MTLLEEFKARLGRVNLSRLSRDSGVPLRTILRIKAGDVTHVRVTTLERLSSHLITQEDEKKRTRKAHA